MDDIIIRTKIIPEKNTSGLLSRPHLLELLNQNSDKKLILVSSGAGYGKTTLVKQFLSSGGKSYSWYSIDETDNNLFTFLAYLISSVSNRVEKFGESSQEILDSIRSREGTPPAATSVVSTVCGTMINEFTKTVTDDFFIVLDDFHLLPDEEWVNTVMNYILGYIPENFHIIITTREELPFDVSKLKAKRKYFEISAELKFSGDEVSKLAKQEYNTEIKDEDLPYFGKFGGWVTGLHMFLQGNRDTAFEFLKQDVLPENLYNYFAEDIYNSEKESVQEFLLNSSLLENFTAGECDLLFEMKNSRKILDELSSRNIFIQRTEVAQDGRSEYIYNYQPLFRDFLKVKFKEQTGGAERKMILNKIAAYYKKKKDYPSAIKYFLLGEEYEQGLELIMKFIDEAGKKTNFHMASDWLKMFPPFFEDDNPEMLFYKGLLKKNLDGDYEAALVLFKKSLELQIDKSYKARKFIAESLIATGKINEAEKTIESVLKEEPPLAEKAVFLYWHGIVQNNLSQYDIALENFEKALEIANTEDVGNIKYSILNELGNINLIKGDYTKAAFYYESVISNISNLYNKFQTINNIVQVYSYEGNFQKAKEYLKEAEEFVKIYSSRFFKVNYLLSSAYLEFMLCNYGKSINAWQELVSISVKSKIPYYIYIGNLNLAICYYYLKDYKKSREYFHLSEDLSHDFDQGEKIYLRYWIALLQKETDFNPVVGKEIETAFEYFTEKLMMYERVHSLYHLGDFYLLSGSTKKALEFLDKAIDEGIDKKFITIFQKEFLFKRTLFDLTSDGKLHSGFIENLIADIFELADISGIELETLYDIKLETFGNIKIMIRGKEIPDDKWVRKVRKLIFTYILLSRRTITKDSLIDLFYPDSDPDNATSVFHQTLSNIRSIIKWAVSDGEKQKGKQAVPEYLIYENQRLSLNPNYIYYIDAFEFEKLYKKGSSAEIKENEKLAYFEKALDLYKGEFLEGYYQPWCEEMREIYNNYYFSILDSIIEIYKNNENYDKVSHYSRILLKSDNLNEDAYIYIIDAEIKRDSTEEAKRIFSAMKDIFKKELGEQPSPGSLKKIEKLFQENSVTI